VPKALTGFGKLPASPIGAEPDPESLGGDFFTHVDIVACLVSQHHYIFSEVTKKLTYFTMEMTRLTSKKRWT
jgi:hypothetical protein